MAHFALTAHHVQQLGVLAGHHGVHCSALLSCSVVQQSGNCMVCNSFASNVLGTI